MTNVLANLTTLELLSPNSFPVPSQQTTMFLDIRNPPTLENGPSPGRDRLPLHRSFKGTCERYLRRFCDGRPSISEDRGCFGSAPGFLNHLETQSHEKRPTRR